MTDHIKYIVTSSLFILYNILAYGQVNNDFTRDGDFSFCSIDVILTSQAEVDAFTCTKVQGSLTIAGNDISDLGNLNDLVSVEGYLDINNNPSLTVISGFPSLNEAGMGIRISNNNALETISGFQALHCINAAPGKGAILISHNPSLTEINGFGTLTTAGTSYFSIENNTQLANVNGFSSLTSLSGNIAVMLSIKNNPALVNLNGLSALSEISGTYSAKCNIYNNDALTDLDGLCSLNAISSLNASLEISGNNSLGHINGLSSLSVLGVNRPGKLVITDNTLLDQCCGMYPLLNTYLPYTLNISNNGTNCTIDDIRNGGACSVACGTTVKISSRSAYDEVHAAFSLYPNPGSGDFNLVIQNGYAGAVHVVVYNLGGKVVKEEVLEKAGQVCQKNLDLGALPKGTYILSVKYPGNDRVMHKKLVTII